MAVLNLYRKKVLELNSFYFSKIIAKKKNVDLIWFNARTATADFYEKLGYQKVGLPLEIKEIDEHSLMFKKLIN